MPHSIQTITSKAKSNFDFDFEVFLHFVKTHPKRTHRRYQLSPSSIGFIWFRLSSSRLVSFGFLSSVFFFLFLQAIRLTVGRINHPQDSASLMGKIEMEHPDKLIDNFRGAIELEGTGVNGGSSRYLTIQVHALSYAKYY